MAEAPIVPMRPIARLKNVARRRVRILVPFIVYRPQRAHRAPDVRMLANLTCQFREQNWQTFGVDLTINHCVMAITQIIMHEARYTQVAPDRLKNS